MQQSKNKTHTQKAIKYGIWNGAILFAFNTELR